MKLLVVEDDPRLSTTLGKGLREEGHTVDVCRTGEEAREQGARVDYDAIILDWMLPDADGLDLLRGWRKGGLSAPVLMLTARGTVDERVLGLRAGADDYLTKPFDFEELLARVEALHRRAGGGPLKEAVGDVALDARRRVLIRGAKELSLTGREYSLAAAFFERPGESFSRADLLDKVWGADFDGQPNVVDVYVGYLRRKLQRLETERVAIRAVRGVGFRLVVTEGLGP